MMVLDPVDNCPNDSTKFFAGICGCGVPDADTDGDSVANCIDLCPTDSAKSVPEVCGCGVADIDLNNNNTMDCLDPQSTPTQTPTPTATQTPAPTPTPDDGISTLSLSKPTLKQEKAKLFVTLLAKTGVTYEVQFATTRAVPGKKKKKTILKVVRSVAPAVTLGGLKVGDAIAVTYRVISATEALHASSWSTPAKFKVKQIKK